MDYFILFDFTHSTKLKTNFYILYSGLGQFLKFGSSIKPPHDVHLFLTTKSPTIHTLQLLSFDIHYLINHLTSK